MTAEGGGLARFRVALECAVADRAVCADVIAGAASVDDPERCVPVDGGDGSLTIEGTIDGTEIRAVLRRRTDCEMRAHDRVARAIGL